METKKTIIGIDLGTTNSLVSFIKNESPRIIPNPRGGRMTPSVVFFKEDGDVMVGEMAKNRAVLDCDHTISNVKLLMGRDKKFNINGHSHTPASISSLILKNLKEYAQSYLGQEVKDAVITVPAYFDDPQRDDTLKAAEMAELNVLKLLNEPTAAALAFGFSKNEDSNLLVVDFGGGTLDITLMKYKNGVFRVRGVGGSTEIGGNNFDKVIIDHLARGFKNTHDFDLSQDKIAYQQLSIHSEKAKTDLSSTNETRIMIPYITATPKGPVHLNTSLSRPEFENLISPILEKIKSHILQTFEHARLTPQWVDSVILVGGSTRVPAVERLVRNIVEPDSHETSIKIKRNINPDEAVARGAGIMAGIMEQSISNIEFHDITPHDLGVEDDKGNFITILKRGTAYPAEAYHLFTTTRDFQEQVCIHVLQKVGTDNGDLVSLGWFCLEIANPGKKGDSDIDVTFAIDTNGLLNVSAIDINSGKSEEITIKNKSLANKLKKSEEEKSTWQESWQNPDQ
ncbi:Chaperone Hsp70 family protein [Desulfonema limicola]|uniref:Chaperone Hsp70 family protein n=1 Tax=Desulfonema limicola TaxID=45656 RepID=A0A975GE71_9BACT|nr:Hsp70 family protein [Desulfonema limicola]QTA77936.1 Chaperone Hsp70 family protein [Desulfonema limicola]